VHVERRFWEARKIWSSMIASIRDFSRIAHASLSGWDREHTLQLLAVSLLSLPPSSLSLGEARGVACMSDALHTT